MYIGLDIDGTVVEHAYPKMGEPVPHAIRVLKRIQENHQIITVTMRDGKTLDDAVKYLEDSGIKIWAKNINPSQFKWTQSRKIFCHQYIDDANAGCPLIYPKSTVIDSSSPKIRPYVDWLAIEKDFEEKGII